MSTTRTARLEDEPYGSCIAHRSQLRQYVEPCDVHGDVEGLVVLVACVQGCEVLDFHACQDVD